MPPSLYQAKRKATDSPEYSKDNKASGSLPHANPTFLKLFDSAGSSALSSNKKSRLDSNNVSPAGGFGSQSKLKRPSSSASPRLTSLSEKFSFKPTTGGSPSSTVFSRYNSMLGSSTSPVRNGARSNGLDAREEIIAKRLQTVFRSVPPKMINFAVKKMGTFDSAADWLDSQDFALSKNSQNSSTTSSSRSSPSIAAAAAKTKLKAYDDFIASDSEPEIIEQEEDDDDDLIGSKNGFLQAKREVSKPTMSIRQKFSHRSAQETQEKATDEIEEVVVVPKRRLVRGSHMDEEIFISDESDVGENYDDEQEIEFEKRVLEFMNTASVEDIADMAACELSMAQTMVDSRPFDSLDEARQVSTEASGRSRKKSIGEKIIDAASTVSSKQPFFIYY